jgi:hypothetical protein
VDHDYYGQRYPLSMNSPRRTPRTLSICSYSFPENEPSQTAPIVYDGVLYATTAHYRARWRVLQDHRFGLVGIYNKIDPDLSGSNPTITVFTLKR